MSLRHALLLAVVVIIAGALGGAYLWWNRVPLHKHDYVAADERVLAALPAAPGMREVSRSVESDTKSSCDGSMTAACAAPSRVVGYNLWVTYSLRRDVPIRSVIAWYRRHLRGWRETNNVPAPLYVYVRGHDRVVVDAQQVPYSPRQVQITVDAKP